MGTKRYRPGGAPRISRAAEQRLNERYAAERERNALFDKAIAALQEGDKEAFEKYEAEAKSVVIPDYL